MSFKNIEELYKAYSWKSASKFVPLATKYGFTSQEARTFLKNRVDHDVIPKKPVFMHIYSKSGNEYQMDTFINDKRKGGVNYLVFINVNTRKAYAYTLSGKGSETVLKALKEFVADVPEVKRIVSDQDSAYLNEHVLKFMKEHGIDYRTTEDNDHNVLGIVNRFMRTIRDYFEDNRTITPTAMKSFMEAYNASPHKSLNGISPNEMNQEHEDEYIKTMSSVNPYKFNVGDHVKIVNVRSPLTKKRRNVSKEAYIVDSRVGNQFIVKSQDDSIDKFPGYMLVKTTSNNIAETLKDGKRGIIERIVSYNPKTDKYKVVYVGGVTDSIKAKNLREGAPTRLSTMEIEYWTKKGSEVPQNIRKWL